MKSSIEIPDLSGLVFDASHHQGIIYPPGDFWVFAYGSLMWNPEFDYLRSEIACLSGYHRCLCLWSVEYRGTVERPGLVMGLDIGGSCLGRAFLISEKNAPQIIDRLNEREMITGAYQSALKPLRLNTDETVEGICLIARQDHPQFAPGLSIQHTTDLVRYAHGKRGSNREYVLNTIAHLREMGLQDPTLDTIGVQLESLDPT
jgi:cation transport protein ChaC